MLKVKTVPITFQFLKYFLECEVKVKELREVVNDYKIVKRRYSDIEIEKKLEKYFKTLKAPTPLLNFFKKHEDALKTLVNHSCLTYFINHFTLKDEKGMNEFLDYLEKTNIKVVEKFYEQLMDLQMYEFLFTTESLDCTENLLVGFGVRAEEYENIITDGNIKFLGKYYSTNYPMHITEANYILKIINPYSNLDKLTIRSMDIILPTREEYKTTKKTRPNFDNDELIKRSQYVKHLFTIMVLKKEMLNKLSVLEDCKKDYTTEELIDTIQLINKQIINLETKEKVLHEKYKDYDLSEEELKLNLQHFQSCEKNIF